MKVGGRAAQMLLTTAGAFVAFSLMTIAVGTDYWLYSPGVCRASTGDNDTNSKNEEVLTHSGLWRQCCMEGMLTGVCKNIDHFPEDAEYERDAAEYLLRAVRAYSLFPIMSVGLLFVGGVCVAASEFYKHRHNVILSAGIFFVSAGLSNIIGIIVYISASAGDPNQGESKRSHWYGWSFYCGALSFVLAETVGVLTVHLFIETHRALRVHVHRSLQRCGRAPSSSSPRPRARSPSPSLHGNDLATCPLGRDYAPPLFARDSSGARAASAHFRNAVNTSDAHTRVRQDAVGSDNGFLPNRISADAKAFGFLDAHVKTALNVDSGPVVSRHTSVASPVKRHGLSPLSGITRRTTPV
ncbi:voltage-dependent calcium channel gamma-3 subunit [Brachyhypopomus gauderio]|uniref:voltage-dependent calcium channel gamma-3 subunit n=1 Tax=Brachyhypopomus gauderio TaxID=698409 RepID=UPI00404252CD